jgi:ribosome maturation factor RimP
MCEGALGPLFLPSYESGMQKEAIIRVIEEWMDKTTFFLVDVNISHDNEVQIEFDSETDDVDIDDCASLSTFIESRFDRNIEDYSLEVGSAGLGKPFKVLKQFEKNIGNEVEVLPKTGKKCSGVLKSVNSETFSIELTVKVRANDSKRPVNMTETLVFSYEEVKSVRYVIRFS